jgi:subtilase family serine protease
VALADQAAVAAGVTVVASSGDAGPFNNIGSPATSPGVIAVGGTTTYRVYRQTTRYGTQLSPGGWENNNITALSTATDLGAPADHQGAGLVNTLKAVQLAESINSGSPQGAHCWSTRRA